MTPATAKQSPEKHLSALVGALWGVHESVHGKLRTCKPEWWTALDHAVTLLSECAGKRLTDAERVDTVAGRVDLWDMADLLSVARQSMPAHRFEAERYNLRGLHEEVRELAARVDAG